MSWFKRTNERINKEGAASAAPSTFPFAGTTFETRAERSTRLTDTERLGYDAVNLPDHYRRFKIEPMRYAVENALNIFQFSINKYVSRYPHKNGVEDLKKAARILDMAIAFEEGDPDWWRLPGERASRRTYIV